MNPLNLIKSVVEIVVSVGVGSIVGNAIKQTTPANAHIVKRISVGIGGFVLSSMVSHHATNYTSKTIDETVEKIKNIRKPEQHQDEIKLN